jgi:hypothetical protein
MPDISGLHTCVLDRSETTLCSKRTIRATVTAIPKGLPGFFQGISTFLTEIGDLA